MQIDMHILHLRFSIYRCLKFVESPESLKSSFLNFPVLKRLNNIRKNRFLKNSLLELEKYFIEQKIEKQKLKERLFFKPVTVSVDDTDKFE